MVECFSVISGWLVMYFGDFVLGCSSYVLCGSLVLLVVLGLLL